MPMHKNVIAGELRIYIINMYHQHAVSILVYKRVFLQTHNISNNANISIRGFTYAKTNNSCDKMLPPVKIEPRPLTPSLTLYFLGQPGVEYWID